MIENQELTKDLFAKYDLQMIDIEKLAQKYSTASKKMQKLISAILKERGFDRSEIISLLKSNQKK
ncbi:hypothetical protein D3C71_1271710 [compost metagenome]